MHLNNKLISDSGSRSESIKLSSGTRVRCCCAATAVLISLFALVLSILAFRSYEELRNQMAGFHAEYLPCAITNKKPAIDILNNFGLQSATGVQETLGPIFGSKAFRLSASANLHKRSREIFAGKWPRSFVFQARFRLNQFTDSFTLISIRNHRGTEQFMIQFDELGGDPAVTVTTLDGNKKPKHKNMFKLWPEQFHWGKWHFFELKVTPGSDYRQVTLYVDCQKIESQSMDFHGPVINTDGDTRIFFGQRSATATVDLHQMLILPL